MSQEAFIQSTGLEFGGRSQSSSATACCSFTLAIWLWLGAARLHLGPLQLITKQLLLLAWSEGSVTLSYQVFIWLNSALHWRRNKNSNPKHPTELIAGGLFFLLFLPCCRMSVEEAAVKTVKPVWLVPLSCLSQLSDVGRSCMNTRTSLCVVTTSWLFFWHAVQKAGLDQEVKDK